MNTQYEEHLHEMFENKIDEFDDEKKMSMLQRVLSFLPNGGKLYKYRSIDDPSFANPPSMLQAIDAFCERTGQPKPENDAQVIRLIFESLALKYREVLEDLDRVASFPIERLHIIGGGSKNRLLNQYTANAIGKRVVAGPSEATAIGNIKVQAEASGELSIDKPLRLKGDGMELKIFLP